MRLPFQLPLVPFAQQFVAPDNSAEERPNNTIAIPTTTVAIPAYTQVRREHLWDAKRGKLSFIYLAKDQVPEGVFTDLSQIIGRVLDHSKKPGYVFTEDDFYPKGTREGLVAGVPASKMMLLINAKTIAGLHGLRPGDRFDVIETIPVDAKAADLPGGSQGIHAERIALEMRLSNWSKQAQVQVIVHGAMVVSPVAARAEPTTSSSLTRGTVSRTIPIQEIYIALDPSEVAPLSQAIAVKSDVRAVIRSGRAEASPEISPSDLRPKNPLQAAFSPLSGGDGARTGLSFVEQVSGGKRKLLTVPSYNSGDAGSEIRIVPAAGPSGDDKSNDRNSPN
ncbi:MAG: hypothetical protein AAF517_06280 [Planctomycetota bacterium]